MNWRQFQRLSYEFQEMQLTLLCDAAPEEMSLQGLLSWGRLLSNCLRYSYKISSDDSVPEEYSAHWNLIRSASLDQMQRVGHTLTEWVAAAVQEGTLTAKDRCAVFDLAGLCSQGFQDEADGLRLQAELSGKVTEVPSFVSTEALSRLAEL